MAVAAAQQSSSSSYHREEVPCPLCGSKEYTVLFRPKKVVDDPAKLYGAASGIQGVQTIVQCKQCPMIYENPRFPEEAIIAGYSASNDAGHDSQHGMRRESFLRALQKNSSMIPPPGAKVLDVGTAGGAFLEAATQYGYEAHGLEPSRFLVEKGKARGLKIEQGTAQHNNFQPGSFDLITFWDVLEHLCNPKEDLAMVRKLLKPGGVLLINYPDIGTWQAKLAGEKFWWLLSVHLTHFNPQSISEICKRSGYEVFSSKPYWQTLQFGYLQDMAIHLKVPLAKLFKSITPGFIQKLPMPYYASQTTALARRKE